MIFVSAFLRLVAGFVQIVFPGGSEAAATLGIRN